MLWIDDSYNSQKQMFEVKNFVLMDLLPTNTQLFTSQDVECKVVVMFLSALILTAPIHCRGCIGE